GNNSAFTVRVLSSTGTDTYSAISAAVGSLKGPKHGGANDKMLSQMTEIKENVHNWEDENEIMSYLKKILNKEAGDGKGLIYGIGHAVYTVSDPRATILKARAAKLAEITGYEKEFALYDKIERLAPVAFREVKGIEKDMCANVDFYSGFVYQMLKLPQELYTPIFAMSRIVGWSAHRIEEVMTNNKIMRPAYKSTVKRLGYTPMAERNGSL
ncbi:MAG: citrate synthase, partial [Clostridia bacterium]|nr:citrate synthase [Clostridia bacterium]